jgi:hypothetical protein
LSDARVQEAIDELDAAEENRDVARWAIREGGDNAIASIAELDDPTVLYEFVGEVGEDATGLIRQFDDQAVRRQFFNDVAADVTALARDGTDVTDLFTANDRVARTIIRKWGDDDRLDADALRVMDGQRDEVSSLIDDLDGLNDRDGGELLVSYGAYSKEFDPNVDPADRQVRSVDEVQADLRRLADADVDNVAEAIKSSTTSADGGGEIPTLERLDGEADAATTLPDNPT